MTATLNPIETSNGVTPAEHEFPLIISVDDHILEPRDLWQRELPASVRDRGPRVFREKAKSSFQGGVLSFERDAPDGKWCDVWVYDDLVLGTTNAPYRRSIRAKELVSALTSGASGQWTVHPPQYRVSSAPGRVPDAALHSLRAAL